MFWIVFKITTCLWIKIRVMSVQHYWEKFSGGGGVSRFTLYDALKGKKTTEFFYFCFKNWLHQWQEHKNGVEWAIACCVKLHHIGVIVQAKLPKIALRMHSGKLGRFQCLISLHGCIVENREMSHFSCIYQGGSKTFYQASSWLKKFLRCEAARNLFSPS